MSKEEGKTIKSDCPACSDTRNAIQGTGELPSTYFCLRCLGTGKIKLENVKEGETLEKEICLKCEGTAKLFKKEVPLELTGEA